MAADLFRGMRSQVALRAQAFLNSDKEALALRESVKQAAATAVEANMESAGGSAEQKADAKKYASAHVEKAGVVSALLNKYAGDASTAAVPDDRVNLVAAKAKEGYDSVAPQPKTTLDKQKTEAAKQAARNARTEADRLTTAAIDQLTTSMKADIKANAGFLNSRLDVQDLGKDEAQLRQQLDSQLVEDRDIDTVYTNKLFDPIKQAVLMKLGVGRSAFRRSKELNDFRQSMKDSAREQARSDIDGQLDTNALAGSSSPSCHSGGRA